MPFRGSHSAIRFKKNRSGGRIRNTPHVLLFLTKRAATRRFCLHLYFIKRTSETSYELRRYGLYNQPRRSQSNPKPFSKLDLPVPLRSCENRLFPRSATPAPLGPKSTLFKDFGDEFRGKHSHTQRQALSRGLIAPSRHRTATRE